MARPIVRNMYVVELGYNSGTTYKPSVRINCDIQDADGDFVDVDVFEYVKVADRQSYVASDTVYLTGWSVTDAYQSVLYAKMVRTGATDEYTVSLYNDVSRTELVAQGVGDVSTTISLTEQNDSGITATVDKNASHLATLDFTLDDSTAWQTATNLSGTTPLTGIQTNVAAPGRSTSVYWDVVVDESATDEPYQFRIRVDDSSETSLVKGYAPFDVIVQTPTLAIAFDDYTNQRTFVFDLNVTGTSISLFRVAESVSALTSASWHAITYDVSQEQATITFATSTQGDKTVYVEVADSFYNRSSVQSDVITYHTTAPQNLYLNVLGSAGNGNYTGVIVRDDGSFELTDEVTLTLYAEDLTDIQIYIDGNLKDASNVRQYIAYTTEVTVRLSGELLGNDTTNSITVTFKDLAGNTSNVGDTIRYNSKIYNLAERNLRSPSTIYDHQIFEVSQSGNPTLMSKTNSSSGQYVRKWEDVFYPTTHSYPVNADGSINESAAIAMNETSNTSNGAVRLSGGNVLYDAEGRATNTDWVKSGSKDYLNMESSYEGGFRYWIIDNYGYGEIALQFEYFFMDSNVYGPPYNNMAPYRGDSVVIYDASAPGAVQEVLGRYGRTEYTLLDSTKLVELQAYSGEGGDAFSLSTGRTVNPDPNGSFNPTVINTTTRICVVLYSDPSGTASGFKLKAGPRHALTWYNYDMDEANGELWIHKYPSGNAPTLDVRAIYDYYDQATTIDYDTGKVTFEAEPTGIITTDYTYYGYDDAQPVGGSRLFSASSDDFVDFQDVNLYVVTSGISPDKDAQYVHGYPTAPVPDGKITQFFTVDKDRGLVEFADGTSAFGEELAYVPSARLFMDYSYHTFLRLSNDGYGDFSFRDELMVADDTPQFPDYTWGDIKIVNEGDAILEDGKMKFLMRGYDTDGDGTVDQVLDVNRPWDIQKGTPAETYQKVAAEIRTNYTWSTSQSKSGAQSILGSWQNRAFGFDVYPEQIFFGRIVWVLGGTGGTSYPTTTTGDKVFSAEVEGKYYNIVI